MSVWLRWLFCCIWVVGSSGCASTPSPWYRREVRELTATITALEADKRLLSLQDETGISRTIYVGPEVRNYERLKVGDRVVATYQEAIAAAVTRPDQSVKEPQVGIVTQRSGANESPHAELSASLIATVAIEAVDLESSMLTFSRDDGLVRTVRVEDSGAKKFIEGLKPGDLVTVTYTEAFAISVRPAAVL